LGLDVEIDAFYRALPCDEDKRTLPCSVRNKEFS
jgi:hypothetical protein